MVLACSLIVSATPAVLKCFNISSAAFDGERVKTSRQPGGDHCDNRRCHLTEIAPEGESDSR